MQIYDAANLNIGLPRVVTPYVETIWPGQWPLVGENRAKCPPDDLIRKAVDEMGEAAYIFLDDAHRMPIEEQAKWCDRFKTIGGPKVGIYQGMGGGNVRNVFYLNHWVTGSVQYQEDFAAKRVLGKTMLRHVDALMPCVYQDGSAGQYTSITDPVQAWQFLYEHTMHIAYRFNVLDRVLPFAWIPPGVFDTETEKRAIDTMLTVFERYDQDFIVWGRPEHPLSKAIVAKVGSK